MQSWGHKPAAASRAPIAQSSLLAGAIVGAAAACLVAIGVIIGLLRVGLMVAHDERLPPLASQLAELRTLEFSHTVVADHLLSQAKDLAARLETVDATLGNVADQALSRAKDLAARIGAVEAVLGKLVVTTGNEFDAETTTNAGAEMSIQIGNEWRIVGTGDFNGDGKTDLLLRHARGPTNVFLMDGARVIGGSNTSIQAGNDWQVRAIGDFNGDGKSDILWRNADGGTRIWLMDGSAVLAASAGSK